MLCRVPSVAILKSASEALGMSEMEIQETWRLSRGNRLRLVLEYEIEKLIYDRRMSSDPKTIEDLHFERGFREACTVIKGILNRKS